MKQAGKFLAELMLRLKSESPEAFKKLQWILGLLVGLIGATLTLNEVLSIGLGNVIIYGQVTLTQFLGVLAALFSGALGTATTAVKNPEKLKK